MPRFCTPLPGGGFACGSRRRTRCRTPGCTNWGEVLCDFPAAPGWAVRALVASRRAGTDFPGVVSALQATVDGACVPTPELHALLAKMDDDDRAHLAEYHAQLTADPKARLRWLGTCSMLVCRRCAVNLGPEKDLCPAHGRLWNGGPT